MAEVERAVGPRPLRSADTPRLSKGFGHGLTGARAWTRDRSRTALTEEADVHTDDSDADRADPAARRPPAAWPEGPGIPPESRMRRGPVAVVECFEEIPCDPCEPACPRGAIRVGSPITNLPVLDPDGCDGCGLCIPACPGQAVFVVDLSLPDGMASVSMPYEFLPLPRKGDVVVALDRDGQPLGPARVLRVANPRSFDKTPVVTIEVPETWAASARGVRVGGS